MKKPFDRNKIVKSIRTAMRKRNFSDDKIEEIAEKIIIELESVNGKEIQSVKIGNLIMRELANIDQVAYIRFASVYKDFADAKDFARFIDKLKLPIK